MKNNLKLFALLTALATSGSAFADWSAVTGETVGEGNNVIHAQAGLPGISGRWFHGMSDKFDLGARFAFDYLYAGGFTGFGFAPGIRPAAILKFNLMQQDKFSMALRFEPGIDLFFAGGFALFGIGLPVSLDMGIRVNDKVAIPIFAELPMSLNLTNVVIFNIPIKVGAGVEWKFAENMALTGRMAFGPVISAGGGFFGGGVGFALDTLIGMEFKL